MPLDLNQLLSSYNICSKEWIIRQYHHEVQGQTVIKPLHGKPEHTGPGDASVIWPFESLLFTGTKVKFGIFTFLIFKLCVVNWQHSIA